LPELTSVLYGYGGVFPVLLSVGSFSLPGPLLELQTSPTDYVTILEFGFGVQGNLLNFSVVCGIGTPAVHGVGINSHAINYDDSSNTNLVPNVKLFSWWSIPPSTPSKFYRRNTFNTSTAAITPVIFSFPRGLKVAPSSSVVLWLIAGFNNATSLLIDPILTLDG
jgi:hypothetical protein